MSSGAGSHDDGSTPPLSTFLSTLIPVLLISSVVLTVFFIYRPKVQRVYEPRSYIPLLDEHEKTPKTSPSRFGWIKDFRSVDDGHILNHSSMDNYFFLRMFKILFFICLVGSCITWPILFPVNATGGGGGIQFNILSFSNVSIPKKINYYYAPALVAWVFLAFVMLVITRETVLFINIRQAVILSQSYRSRLSTKTVLFTSVPEGLRNEAAMRERFAGVRYVWIQPNIKELTDLVGKRDKAFSKLEGAENKLCRTLVKNNKKADKKAAKAAKKGKSDDIALVESDRDGERQPTRTEVPKKERPTHRLKFLIGKKVDTIDWARPEIQALNEQINAKSAEVSKADHLPAIFVEFDSLEAAQAAFRQVSRQKKREMHPMALGVQPLDVIWKNLGNGKTKNTLLSIASNTFVTLMVIFWAIPVAFVGAISNIGTLDTISFLTWIQDIPSVILGVVSGLLPSVMLAVLMALVPIVLRILAGKFLPTHSAVELKVQSWYFAFQVVDVFLVTTFASGAAATAKQIVSDPSSAPTLLAQNLPLASNFYTAYFVVTMLQQSAMLILNIAPLLFALVLGKLLDKTPRKVFNRYTNLIGLGWGSVYPSFVMLGCIALAYSCVAPLLLGFATVGFGLLYLAYRYQLLYVVGNKSIDMKGRAYARGLQQLFVGIYLSEFCLIGLFAIGVSSSAAATGPLVLMIIFAVFTVVYHVILKKTLGPLINGLELVPGSEVHGSPAENQTVGDAEEGNGNKDYLEPAQSVGRASTVAPVGGLRGKLLKFFFHTSFAKKWFYPKKSLAAHFDNPTREYSELEYEEAFLPPAITSRLQPVWIARDEYGLSHQEVAGCEDFNVRATDEEATLNEKAGVQWNNDRIRDAPIYQEYVPY